MSFVPFTTLCFGFSLHIAPSSMWWQFAALHGTVKLHLRLPVSYILIFMIEVVKFFWKLNIIMLEQMNITRPHHPICTDCPAAGGAIYRAYQEGGTNDIDVSCCKTGGGLLRLFGSSMVKMTTSAYDHKRNRPYFKIELIKPTNCALFRSE